MIEWWSSLTNCTHIAINCISSHSLCFSWQLGIAQFCLLCMNPKDVAYKEPVTFRPITSQVGRILQDVKNVRSGEDEGCTLPHMLIIQVYTDDPFYEWHPEWRTSLLWEHCSCSSYIDIHYMYLYMYKLRGSLVLHVYRHTVQDCLWVWGTSLWRTGRGPSGVCNGEVPLYCCDCHNHSCTRASSIQPVLCIANVRDLHCSVVPLRHVSLWWYQDSH